MVDSPTGRKADTHLAFYHILSDELVIDEVTMFSDKPITEGEVVEFLRRQCDDMYIAQSIWKPLDISKMGRRVTFDKNAPILGHTVFATWEWKRFGYSLPYNYSDRYTQLPLPYITRNRDLYFAFAYNPIDDILFYDDFGQH